MRPCMMLDSMALLMARLRSCIAFPEEAAGSIFGCSGFLVERTGAAFTGATSAFGFSCGAGLDSDFGGAFCFFGLELPKISSSSSSKSIPAKRSVVGLPNETDFGFFSGAFVSVGTSKSSTSRLKSSRSPDFLAVVVLGGASPVSSPNKSTLPFGATDCFELEPNSKSSSSSSPNKSSSKKLFLAAGFFCSAGFLVVLDAILSSFSSSSMSLDFSLEGSGFGSFSVSAGIFVGFDLKFMSRMSVKSSSSSSSSKKEKPVVFFGLLAAVVVVTGSS
mmetsp:Transcript_4451/g.16799  ORF Transcript_4451/g.16799 Transcript_4451/m.16799 type:complete len:275 (-) Transcript_4451:1464-2288(-)